MDLINRIADWSMLVQVILGLLLYKYMRKYINKTNSINTLVLMPILPYTSLVLYALIRAKHKEYFDGFIIGIILIPLVVVMSGGGGSTIYIMSIAITCIVYGISDGIGPVIIGLVIGWLCKDMVNPISFIISCNIISNYIVTRVIGLTSNKFKWSKESYDNNGQMKVVGAGLLEAIFVGAPSDVISDNKDKMDGLADILCISNMLLNGSMRGSSTVLVTDWLTTIIFVSLLVIIYYYGELDYVNDWDKVWPATYDNSVIKVPNWELAIVIFSLIASGSLTDYMTIIKFVVIVGLSLFVRIKVSTSLFFSSRVLFG